jgi:multidrug resistance efflux pump
MSNSTPGPDSAVAPSPQPAAAPQPAPAASPAVWSPPRRHPWVTAFIVVAAVGTVLLVLDAWHLPPFRGTTQTTDNAYVRGRTAVIAPQVSGYVVEVPVKDFQEVQAGQLIARIDDRIYRARVAQAQANLDAQLAALANNAQAQA